MSESPAAKIVAVAEIQQLQTASWASSLVNRALNTALVIALVMIHGSFKFALDPRLFLTLTGFIVQLSWALREAFSVLQIRRARYRLALVDSTRFSAEWEDKFVGLRVEVLPTLYASMIEPAAWLMLFLFLFLSTESHLTQGLSHSLSETVP